MFQIVVNGPEFGKSGRGQKMETEVIGGRELLSPVGLCQVGTRSTRGGCNVVLVRGKYYQKAKESR